MNIFLLAKINSDNKATLDQRQVAHLHFLKKQKGDHIKVGLLGGNLGEAEILHLNATTAEIQTNLTELPPSALNLTVVLALPRPKVLWRILKQLTVLGIKSIYLINCYRVEKSYWQSFKLENEKIKTQLRLALEQSGDTILPGITQHQYFKPFIEDQLAQLPQPAIVAHPGGVRFQTRQKKFVGSNIPRTLILGPDGGFIPYEIELMKAHGAMPVSFADRILYSEVAPSFIIGQWQCLAHW